MFFSDRSTSSWHVVLGDHHLLKADAHQIVVGVSKVLVHENYDQDTTENDITLLKLTTPVTLNNYVNIACLPTKTVTSGQHCYITGFGDTMGNFSLTIEHFSEFKKCIFAIALKRFNLLE